MKTGQKAIVGRALRLPRIWHRATGAVALQLTLIAASFGMVSTTCWDAASEFNDSNNPDAANPSGVWSYGWKKTLVDKFYVATTRSNDPPKVSGWCNASGFPMISHISRTVPTIAGVNPSAFPAHAMVVHPGPGGEYGVVRFTAPADGTFKVSGQFYALDDNKTGTTTDVWILKNNDKAGAFSGKVDYHGSANWVSFTSQVFELKKGDTLDFQAGYGDNKTYFYDSTGLVAIIEKIK
ncbi:MAG TPA: hypothetical protein VGI60_12565 [Chthoniobacterales bacterium]|jgi:hypothetical protein